MTRTTLPSLLKRGRNADDGMEDEERKRNQYKQGQEENHQVKKVWSTERSNQRIKTTKKNKESMAEETECREGERVIVQSVLHVSFS